MEKIEDPEKKNQEEAPPKKTLTQEKDINGPPWDRVGAFSPYRDGLTQKKGLLRGWERKRSV